MTEPHVTQSETEKAPRARRQGKQAEEHNAKRRQKYREDMERAERLRKAAREHKRHPTDKDPNANLGRAREFGKMREVEGRGLVLTFTLDDLAPMVQFHAMVVRRWFDGGQLPLPITEAVPIEGDKMVGGREKVPVYTLPEAEVILTVMAKHLSQFRYFRTTDIETIDALARGIREARKG
jgi:hypothetical protein